MQMIIVNMVSFIIILGIVYWFWIFKPKSAVVDSEKTPNSGS